MQCQSCGATNPDSQHFCGTCGDSLDYEPPYTDQPASRSNKFRILIGLGAMLVICLCLLCAGSLFTAYFLTNSSGNPITRYDRWTSANVVKAFRDAGLEISGTRSLTRDDYGPAPMVAKEGTRFLIPSLGKDAGGRIFSFSSNDDLAKMQRYYNELSKSSGILFSWVFVKDNILVQINGSLPDDQAHEYEDALNSLK